METTSLNKIPKRLFVLCIDIEIARVNNRNLIVGVGCAVMDTEEKEIILSELIRGFVKGTLIDEDHWYGFGRPTSTFCSC